MFHHFKTSLLTIGLFMNAAVYGQDSIPVSKHEKNREPISNRLFISPDLGFQFGDVTLVYLAPKVGYRLTDKTAVGIGGTYTYYQDHRYKAYGYTYEENIYGGSIFLQHQLFDAIRAYGEYELLNMQTVEPSTFETKRQLVPSLFVGGGYFQPLGASSSAGIMVLFNLLDGPNSIYDNPVFRIGFNIGL